MKLPEFALAKDISFRPQGGGTNDDILFPAGTLVFPFWNKTLLPQHIRKILDDAQNLANRSWANDKPANLEMIICVIGKYYIPVYRSYIRNK